VSGAAYPANAPGRIVAAWQQGALNVVLSRYILDELVRVLPRLPQNKRSRDEIRNLAETFMFLAEIVEPDTLMDARLRDPADQLVLATLRVSKADYLITGDKDLLALAGTYPIVTPAAFWERHG
jgi:putative PIN family toxin of toxin-antitoxin system